MTEIVPLFPLNIVVFPEERLSLHIFEPRYRQLLQDCMQSDSMFGMPFFFQNKVTEYGTLLKLISVEKTHGGGELDIKTRGCGAFRIKKFFTQIPGKSYSGGEIETLEDVQDEDPVIKNMLLNQLQKFYQALRIDNLLLQPEHIKAYQIGHHLGLSVEQEYQLLQLRKESERQHFILEYLQIAVPELEASEKQKELIRLN